MRKSILFLLTIIMVRAQAQRIDWKKLQGLSPDRILQAEKKPTDVLIIGSFHFSYPQLDDHKTDSSKFINVLSPTRQKELEELADVIRRFKPTRVYVESSWPHFIDSLYNELLAGRYKLGRNEIYQIGFRVAREAGLKKIYSVDASSFAGDNYKEITRIEDMWRTKASVDTLLDKYWSRKYSEWYNSTDSVQTTLTMLENFLLMAEPITLRRMHGAYLTNRFNTTNEDGPDILAMWWYDRNLRTFNNILKTRPAGEDRILVLFGNGHVPILKHCFESSPEFRVVELKSLLR